MTTSMTTVRRQATRHDAFETVRIIHELLANRDRGDGGHDPVKARLLEEEGQLQHAQLDPASLIIELANLADALLIRHAWDDKQDPLQWLADLTLDDLDGTYSGAKDFVQMLSHRVSNGVSYDAHAPVLAGPPCAACGHVNEGIEDNENGICATCCDADKLEAATCPACRAGRPIDLIGRPR